MNRALRRRKGHSFGWVVTAIVLAVLLVPSSQVYAAAGISDIGATNACWLQPPYAVSRCYSHTGGPYSAHLFVARPSRFDDEGTYEGIVPVEWVSSFSRIAVTRGHIILEGSGPQPSFDVIDFQAGGVERLHLRSMTDLQRYLREQGEESDDIRFETFEEVYRVRRPWGWRHLPELVCSYFFLILVLPAAWIYRRGLWRACWGTLCRRPRAAS